MRALAVTIGALLISVSHTALAQEFDGGRPGECARAERQCEPLPAAPLQTSMPPVVARQGEPEKLLADLPERALPKEPAMQAETHDGHPMQPTSAETAASADQQGPEPAEAATRQVEFRQADPEQFLAQLPDRPLADRQADAQKLLAQLPDRPLPDRQAEAENLLAQLPDRPLPDRQAGAEKLLAQLPDADESRQPEAMKARMRSDQPVERGIPGDPRWTAVKERGLGTTMDLPRAMFSTADGHAHKGAGRRYRTRDGRAKVAIWTQRNRRRDTPAGYLRKTFKIPRATVAYQRFTPHFAAVSGIYGARIYYIRCNLSPRGTLHCFDLAYPARERKAWDGIVTRMSRSLRPLYY